MVITVGDLLKEIERLKDNGLIDDKTPLVYSPTSSVTDCHEVINLVQTWKYEKKINFLHDTKSYLEAKEKIKTEKVTCSKVCYQSCIKNYEDSNNPLVLCIN